MSLRLGVDVGGTFTDVLVINETDSRVYAAKVASTQADASAKLIGII